jgi:hypothetical protein
MFFLQEIKRKRIVTRLLGAQEIEEKKKKYLKSGAGP